MKRPRLSPSGPFLPPAPGGFGYVSRVFYEQGPLVETNVVEGAPGPPGTILIDIPIVVAAADLPDLTWDAAGEVRFEILQPEPEEPRLFSLGLTIGIQGAGAPTPTPVQFVAVTGWPHFDVDVDGNPFPQNETVARWAWNAALFAPMAAGTNHVVLGLTFFGGGPPVHNALVGIRSCDLIVREYRGAQFIPPTP